MLDFPLPGDAVLSHRPAQRLGDLFPPDAASLDQAHHHFQVRHHDRRGDRDVRRSRCRLLTTTPPSPSSLVLNALFDPTSLAPVILRAAPAGLLPTVCLATSKRTTKVVAAGVSRMREEKNPTVPAPCQASLEPRSAFDRRSQKPVVRRYQTGNLFPLVPVWNIFKVFRDRYCKKARLSLIMLIFHLMSLFYLADAYASTGSKRGLFSGTSPGHGRSSSLPRTRARTTPENGVILSEQGWVNFAERYRS